MLARVPSLSARSGRRRPSSGRRLRCCTARRMACGQTRASAVDEAQYRPGPVSCAAPPPESHAPSAPTLAFSGLASRWRVRVAPAVARGEGVGTGS